MEEDKTKASEFKVVDRRRFSDSNPSASGTETPTEQETPKKEEPEESSKAEQRTNKAEAQSRKVDFSGFVLGMATQTLMFLGEIPSPESNLVSMNLSAAKETIDILDMLEQKTKGNLNDEEQRLIEDVLAQLRLAFVHKVNQP